MVHTESKVKKPHYLMNSKVGLGTWYVNVPFELIPELLIRQIQDDPIMDYEEYRKLCPWLNSMPNIWNICLVTPEWKIVAFQYGDWHPLIKYMQTIRLSIHPKLFSISPDFLKDCMEAGKKLAEILGARRLYWITCRWKSIMRKLPESVRVMDTRVMEVV